MPPLGCQKPRAWLEQTLRVSPPLGDEEEMERRKAGKHRSQELRVRTRSGRPKRGDALEDKEGELRKGPWSGM